eukprot:scaffold6886_cov164-Amphora_coffeaeformis.AAC.8
MACRGQLVLTFLLVGSAAAWKPSTIRHPPSNVSRRDVFQAIAVGVGGLAVLSPDPASARDEVFKKNPLTSPLLEQIRIWDQAEADDLKYNGELERGDAGNKGKVDAYPRLLVPILVISNDLDQIDQLLSKESSGLEEWKQARQILSKPEFEKINFKKTFNKYGDNIYYSDPDRANLYLGGGATPKTEQSLAYLMRNDILTNVEDMQAELDYLMKTPDEPTDDLKGMIRNACDAMKRYLSIVPPNELQKARDFLQENS